MYTILALIMWQGDLVAEDFGAFDTMEHCTKVQKELDTKLVAAGAKVVSVCIPSGQVKLSIPEVLEGSIRG
tara:strand:+ start:2081 stop:2293 length:213 start_codon:yes stop_codon:yes gene_type:complete